MLKKASSGRNIRHHLEKINDFETLESHDLCIKLNNKIWIQHDGTEIGVANELVEWGVLKEDILLAYHAPYKRPYSGFAVD